MSRPDLRLELVEARAALRAAVRDFKFVTAAREGSLIFEHGGWSKELGPNREDRDRLLLVWLEADRAYTESLERHEEALARVEELTARLEIAADTAQELHDRVLDHYADALLAMADAIRHIVAGASQKRRPLLEYVPADDPYGIGLEVKP